MEGQHDCARVSPFQPTADVACTFRGNPEDITFFEQIAGACIDADRIVLIGHGHGQSNAAHHLAEFLREYHPAIFAKVVVELVADYAALTAPQLLQVGRRALTTA